MSREMKKQIPILTSNFATLIAGDGYYVDKTEFIPRLESLNYPNIFFLRPRRFGKSLHLSMLEYYYGIQYKDKFTELFGECYIGKPENFTPLKNSYYILNFNFSGIKTQEEDKIEKEFNSEISSQILSFLDTYSIGSESDSQIFRSELSSPDLMRKFFTVFKRFIPAGKIYILIDEYDHFTNELFAFNKEHFKDIVSRNGWVRKFYETIKIYMGEGIVDRFFATGVTPVTLDSMTSGFNVAKNITLSEEFHEMAGFTEAEVRSLILGTIYSEGAFKVDEVIDEMRSWYNGSKFTTEPVEKLYNPQLVISFLSEFKRNYEYPTKMADINVISDYKKITKILSVLPIEDSENIIEKVTTEDSILSELTLQFNNEVPYTKSDAISLLFYNGLLTIEKNVYDFISFVIPNFVIKHLYWEFLRKKFEAEFGVRYEADEVIDLISELINEGRVDRLVAYTQNIMKILSVRDFKGFGESQLKIMMLTILSKTNAYLIESERETRAGFPDILLTDSKIFEVKYQYAFELKYIPQTGLKNLATIRKEGIEQLKKYKDSDQIKMIKNLKTFLIIFYNRFEAEFIEV